MKTQIGATLNSSITVYPNALGWNKILESILIEFKDQTIPAIEILDKYRVPENGFKDQIWHIAMYYPFLLNESYLSTIEIKIS